MAAAFSRSVWPRNPFVCTHRTHSNDRKSDHDSATGQPKSSLKPFTNSLRHTGEGPCPRGDMHKVSSLHKGTPTPRGRGWGTHQSVFMVQMKNWEPLVLGPAFAMDRTPAKTSRGEPHHPGSHSEELMAQTTSRTFESADQRTRREAG